MTPTFSVELPTLNLLETVEWDQTMPIQENQPLIQTGGLSNLTPTLGKRLNTSNRTPSDQLSYTSHDFDLYLNEFEKQSNG